MLPISKTDASYQNPAIRDKPKEAQIYMHTLLSLGEQDERGQTTYG